MAEFRPLNGLTTEPDEADALLSAADGHFAFSADPRDGFRFAMDQSGDEDVAVAALSISGRWTNQGDFDQFCMATVTKGSQIWEVDGLR